MILHNQTKDLCVVKLGDITTFIEPGASAQIEGNLSDADIKFVEGTFRDYYEREIENAVPQ